jgi:hypothetical protein
LIRRNIRSAEISFDRDMAHLANVKMLSAVFGFIRLALARTPEHPESDFDVSDVLVGPL